MEWKVASSSSPVSRLKREESNRTKHDSVFSKWKVLIGPSDWENHSLGKEGIERYRMQNLPASCPCPGLYELGIAVSRTYGDDAGRKGLRELDPDRVIAVYLGQADNVRTRLQHYGRAGSHLENGNSVGRWNEDEHFCFQKGGPGLFKEMFSRGVPIVYRWAPMESKKEAERTEAQLLRIFDYAWNKGGNGTRRPNDILVKLDRIASNTTPFPNITRKLQQWKWHHPFPQKPVGIRIKAGLPSTEAESDTCSYQEHNNTLSRIFKFGRSQPRLVTRECSVNGYDTTICGVALGDGSVCRNKPIEGRKRCGQHKGKRINGSIPKLVREGKSHVHDVDLEDGSVCLEVPVHERKFDTCSDHEPDDLCSRIFKFERLQPQLVVGRRSINEDYTTICGVILGDGSVCSNKPIEGRKRCGQHKGMRIDRVIPKLVTEGKSHVHGLGLEDGSVGTQERKIKSCNHEPDDLSSQNFKFDRLQPQLVVGRRSMNEDYTTICGVILGDGSVCSNKPIEGRKRCGQHKGKRINGSISKSVTNGKSYVQGVGSLKVPIRDMKINSCGHEPDDLCSPNFKFDRLQPRSVMGRHGFNEEYTIICGVILGNGSVCRNKPVGGRKRCGRHKGLRINA